MRLVVVMLEAFVVHCALKPLKLELQMPLMGVDTKALRKCRGHSPAPIAWSFRHEKSSRWLPPSWDSLTYEALAGSIESYQ